MRDGVEIREDLRGALTGLAIRLGGFRVATGGSLVAGDEDEPRKVVPAAAGEVQPQRLGHAAMQQPTAGEARALVREVPERAMDEVEAGGGLPDEAAPQSLLEGVDGLVVGSAAREAQRRRVERTPDDGRRGQDLGRRLPDRREPAQQDRTDRRPAACRAGPRGPPSSASTT